MRGVKGEKAAGRSADGVNNAGIGDKKGVRGVFEPFKEKGAVESDYNK